MEAQEATSQSPLPPNLIPPNPSTPWHFSSSVFQRLSQAPPQGPFKKIEIQLSFEREKAYRISVFYPTLEKPDCTALRIKYPTKGGTNANR